MILSATTQGRTIPALSVELRWKLQQRANLGASTGRTLNVPNVGSRLTKNPIGILCENVNEIENGNKQHHNKKECQAFIAPV